ncbi:O-antigen ligase family protein [Flavobacterium covae]
MILRKGKKCINFKNASKVSLQFCVLTSFMTYSFDESHPFFNALTISELFGGVGILLFLMDNYKSFLEHIRTTDVVYLYAFLLLIVCSMGVFVTEDLTNTSIAISKFVYLITLSVVLYHTFLNSLTLFIKAVIVTFFLMIFIGFYDFIALHLDLIAIFPNVTDKYFVSGFRMFGQVGDYTYCFLSFLVPFQFSNFSLMLSHQWRLFLRVCVFLGLVFLVGTVRVSAMFSLIIGFLLWMICFFELKRIKQFLPEICLFFLSLLVIRSQFSVLYDLLWHRLEARIFHRDPNSQESSFIIVNFKYAIKNFRENPFFGNGMGVLKIPVYNVEIHGTYLKLLAETGIVGLFFYFLFLKAIFYKTYSKIRKNINFEHDFFNHYMPFFFSSLVMWFYDFHLRKKEFWIILALILIIVKFNKNNEELVSK